MKTISKRNAAILMSTGLFIIAIFQIITHFVSFPDFAKGSFIGIGIGFLVLSLMVGRNKVNQ